MLGFGFPSAVGQDSRFRGRQREVSVEDSLVHLR